jgi:superfamily II DNA/RNA helicase
MKNQRQIEREVGVVSLPKPIVLVISPTRELALQTADEARNLCTFHDLTVVTLVGEDIKINNLNIRAIT